ncbi:hypothetical protein [Humibacter ginsenosidimutans]|uniref:Uncharacterized protein n=1 Tax=Humibacter ginsenosidimutans TaxID=2599293 RepID=A0A5B8M976_9MICO|nr:hypothetical protein [Humibacter ginsenosidimutans]QDZ15960.1 hypothetical protein FPZ11_15325 [Humibacter ginsenosidimutans]
MNSQTLDTTGVLAAQSAQTLSARQLTAQTLAGQSHPPSHLDRLAMRVGLALIIWSRHDGAPAHVTDESARSAAGRNREAREREARERAWLHLGHSIPRR